MVKLGEQVIRGPPTRTERKEAQEKRRLKQLEQLEQFEKAKEEAQEVQHNLRSARTIEEYEQEYNKLSPRFQQLFSSPNELRQQQTQRIEENIRTADSKVDFHKKQRLKKEQEIQQIETDWQRNRNKTPEARVRFERDREELFEEKREQEAFIRWWGKSKAQIGGGADINDIENWVEANVEVKLTRREQRKQAKEKAKELQRKLDEGGEVLIIEKSFKGEPKEIRVEVADFEKGEFERVARIEAKPVRELEPSKLEIKPKLKHKIKIGEREFEFETSPQKLFIKAGELVTAFGELGKTEAEFISEQNLELQKKGLEIRDGKIQVSEEVIATAKNEVETEQAMIKPEGQSWKEWAMQLTGLGIRAVRPRFLRTAGFPFIIPAGDVKASAEFMTSEKTRAIIRTGAFPVMGLVSKQVSGETILKFPEFKKDFPFIERPFNAWNPILLFQAQQEAHEIKHDQAIANELNKQIVKTQKDFAKLEEPTDAEEKRFRIDIEKYEQNPAWQRLKDKGYITSVSLGLVKARKEGLISTPTFIIGKSLQAIAGIGPFFTPFKFVIGAELLSEGIVDIKGGDVLSGGLQTGIGASVFLAGPIAKGVTRIARRISPVQKLLRLEQKAGLTGLTVGKLTQKLTTSKLSAVALKSGLVVAVSGGVAYFDYKETGDVLSAVTRGVASGVILGGFMGFQAIRRARGVGELSVEQRALIQRDLVKVGPKGKVIATVKAKALAKAQKLSVGRETVVLKKGWWKTKIIYQSRDAKIISGSYKETLVGKLVKRGYPKNVGKVLEEFREPFIIRRTTQVARGDFVRTLTKSQRVNFLKDIKNLEGIAQKLGVKTGITSRQLSIFEAKPEIIKSQDFLRLTKLPHGLRGLRPLRAEPVVSLELVFGKGNRFLKISGDIIKGRMQERLISFQELTGKGATESSLRFLRTTAKDQFKVQQFLTRSKIGKITRTAVLDESGNVRLVEVRQDIKHKIFKGAKPFKIPRTDAGQKIIERLLRSKKPLGVFEAKPQELISEELITYDKIVPKGTYEAVVKKILGDTTGGIIERGAVFNLEGTQRMIGTDIADDLFKVTKISKGGGPSNKAFKSSVDAIKNQLRLKGGAKITGNVQQQIKEIIKFQQKSLQVPRIIETPKADVSAKIVQKVIQDASVGLDVGLAGVLALNQQQQLKNLLQDKLIIKSKQIQRNVVVQTQLQNQVQVQKQLQKQIQQIVQTNVRLSSTALARPVPQITTRITPKIPVPPVILAFLKSQIRKKKKKDRRAVIPELAFLPDFTARALGLSPDVITGKQAQAKIKKILTGLEIRRPVRIKA